MTGVRRSAWDGVPPRCPGSASLNRLLYDLCNFLRQLGKIGVPDTAHIFFENASQFLKVRRRVGIHRHFGNGFKILLRLRRALARCLNQSLHKVPELP